jgi:hypothetical protein
METTGVSARTPMADSRDMQGGLFTAEAQRRGMAIWNSLPEDARQEVERLLVRLVRDVVEEVARDR